MLIEMKILKEKPKVFSFVVFTFYPPHHFLFQDPITLKYGIE